MEAGGGLNIVQLFNQGGWPMYPILFLSVAMLTVTLERLIVVFLQKLKLNPDTFARLFDEAYKKNNNDKAKTVEEMLKVARKKSGVCGDLLVVAMEKYQDGLAKRMGPLEIRQWMTSAVEENAVTEMPQLESHLGWLAVIANVATLMGLFGTVYGMIEAFTAMANSPGGVKADEMAGGIAKALVCTLSGLIVAIPALILYNWIKNFIEAFVLRIQETATKVVDLLAS